jgi:hypothetical protein
MNSSRSYSTMRFRGYKWVSTECTSLPCGSCSMIYWGPKKKSLKIKCAFLKELRCYHHNLELTVWKLSFVSWNSDHMVLCCHYSTLYLELLNLQTVKSIQKTCQDLQIISKQFIQKSSFCQQYIFRACCRYPELTCE